LVDEKNVLPNPSYILGSTLSVVTHKILYAIDRVNGELVKAHQDTENYELYSTSV